MIKIISKIIIIFAITLTFFTPSIAQEQSFSEAQVLRGDEMCEAGNAEVCFILAYAYEIGNAAGITNYKVSGYYYNKACDLKEYTACFNLANNYGSGKFSLMSESGKDIGFARAMELYKFACEGGKGNACANYGLLNGRFANGKKEAVWAFDKACTIGIPSSCFEAGKIYYVGAEDIQNQGGAVPKNIEKAMRYFKIACDGGVSEACF